MIDPPPVVHALSEESLYTLHRSRVVLHVEVLRLIHLDWSRTKI